MTRLSTSFLRVLTAATVALSYTLLAQTPAPKLVSRDVRHALLVDGAPYLVLCAQIRNSSAWPEVLPDVWRAFQVMHVNTAEATVY